LNSLPQLNLDAALVLPEQGGVCIQLTLTAADADGQRALIVSGKLEDVASGWTRHAHALLGAAPEDAGDTLDELSTWPPADDQALALDALYRGLSADGLEYTDSSRSLRAAYRSGEGVLLGEIELPSRAIKEAQRYALHPGLLEGALQLLALATPQPEAFQTVSVSGVRLFATGASRVRARVQIVAPGEATIDLADEAGQPLAQLALVRTRPLGDRAPLEQAHRGRLYRLDWQPIQLPPAAASSFMSGCLVGHPASTALASRPYYPDMAGLCAAIANGATPPQLIVLACAPADPQSAERALAAIQRFVATEPLAASRLVVLTQRAFALEDDLALDLTHAPVWGLVRVLQNEYPDRRVALLDWDGREETSSQALFAGLAAEEAQLLTRDGELLVPRLSETPPSAAGSGLALAPEDTVVISGETAWLGAQLARHLVVEHGARQLLVCSTSAAADALRAELGGVLAGLGVQTRVAVCDLRVRQQVAALLDAIPASTPLRAVFHLTPRLDDVPIASLSTEHLAQAESGAVHLHELTRERELRAFVLFSSLAGTLGQRERGAYAQRWRCLGLPGQSVLFGLWAEPTASGSALVTPLSVADNLRLLDTALALPLPLIAAAAFDPRLPDLAPEVVPTALRSLLRRRLRRAGVLGAGAGSLQLRLRRAAPGTRTRTLLNALLAAVSETLRVEKSKLDPKRALTELGMDSIRALELRSLLAELSQLALPATLLFDHPTPNALAAYLEPRLLAAQSSQTPASAGDSAAPLVAMCTQSRAAGPALRSPIWRLIDAATSLRVQSPGGRAKSGLASRGYALSQGCGGALLICIPALVPPTGPGQYIRFATALAGKRDVSVVSVPGWSLAEALPEDRESLIACLCDSVLALAGERAFVLCGWSSGGWVAHALSATLARRKATPAALVMFDARQIAAEDFAVDPATGLSNVRVNMPVPGQAATQATCDEELTAWTWYFEMFADWLPERLACPSLQFDATGEVPVAEMRLVAHRTPLVAADEVIPLPAHHWSMMIDGAPQTAQHVDAWLDRISLAERAAKPAT
jgi:thioesterase domain-containing protein/acyl carrier protein